MRKITNFLLIFLLVSSFFGAFVPAVQAVRPTGVSLLVHPSLTVFQGDTIEFESELGAFSPDYVVYVTLPGKVLDFFVDGHLVGSETTDYGGIARVTYTVLLDPGSYLVKVAFAGDLTYLPVETTVTLMVEEKYEVSWSGSVGTSIETIEVGDTDNDGLNEFVIYGNDGSIRVFSFDGANYVQEWTADIGSITRGNAIGDVDGDGKNEIVAGTELSGTDGAFFVFQFQSPSSYILEASVTIPSEAGIHDVSVGDTDGDGQLEIVVGEYWGVHVYSFNGVGYALDWQIFGTINFWSDVGDVDGDGIDEIIAARNGQPQNIFIYSYDSPNNYVVSYTITSPSSGGRPFEVRTGDSDGDDVDEILVGDETGLACLYDYDTGTSNFQLAFQFDADVDAYGLDIGDSNNDGLGELAIGDGSGNFFVFGYREGSYNRHWTTRFQSPYPPFVKTVRVGDANNDGKNEILIGNGDILHICSARLIDNWPMFHHDLSLSGVSSSSAPNTNATSWIFNAGSPIFSSPAIANGIAYVGCDDGKLYAVNVDSGSSIWSYQTGGLIRSSPAVESGRVYVLSTDGGLYSLNSLTGALLWRVQLGPGVYDWSSPAVHDNRVFIGISTGSVYCLNSVSGEIIWQTIVGGQPNSPITVANGKVYSGTHNFDANNPTLVALNEFTGSVIWEYNFTTTHSPVVGMINCNGATVVDGDGDGSLEVYFGVVTWSGRDNEAVCLDERTGTEIWTRTLGGWSTSTPAVHNGVVFMGSDDSNVYALSANTGNIVWNYQTKGQIWAAPAIADGKVFVGSLDHVFYALNEQTGQLVWSYNTSESRLLGSPAVANGKVYVGNENGNLYCFGLEDIVPPLVTNVRHEPLYPSFVDEITFYANVTDDVAVDKVQLNYTLDGGVTWMLEDMTLVEDDIYSTSLGPYGQFLIIGFYVIAYDTSGNMGWGSEIVPTLPEAPKISPIVVAEENPSPLPNGDDVWYETTSSSTTVFASGRWYRISYSIDGGLTWITEELTEVGEGIWKFEIPSLTNILFKFAARDGSQSRVYWIIIGPWEYPIYLYFSTAEQYFPVKGLDFDGDSDITNNWASYETTRDNWIYDLVNNDIDRDGTSEVWSYAYMGPKTIDDGCLVIEYWIYYAFNDYPIDRHEHDFESVFVWVDVATGNIKKIACTQHKWVNHYVFDIENPPVAINLAVENGGHGMALLADQNNDGLPDVNTLGSYIIQPGVNSEGGLDLPMFFRDSGTINPNSFVAQLYPWSIYDSRIAASKKHLFDDPSILTNGLSLEVINPLLPSIVSEIPQYYGYLTDLLTTDAVLKTSFGAPLLGDSKLVFMVTAPLYRQEFAEPRLMWNKVSFGWWVGKFGVKLVVSMAVGKGVNSYFKVAGLKHLLVGAAGDLAGKLTDKVISVFVDPAECYVFDGSGGMLYGHSETNDLVGGAVFTERTMTNNLYDLYLIMTDSPNEYLYEVRGKSTADIYSLTVTISDQNGNMDTFDAIEIPIGVNEVHRYLIDWTLLEINGQGVEAAIDKNGDGFFEQNFNSDSELTNEEFEEALITIENPLSGSALQDGVTFAASTSEDSEISSLSFSVREADGAKGIPIGCEDMHAVYNPSTKEWTLFFETRQIADGNYYVMATAEGINGYSTSVWVSFSIRNWVLLKLLPKAENTKAGRTVPIKFSLRVDPAVDPLQPFAYNEELTIRIFRKASSTNVLLQTSVFGTKSTDYRVDPERLYITNFKTQNTQATYLVEINRQSMLVGSFEFSTTK